MTSTQRFPSTNSEHLNKHNKKWTILMRGQQSVFYLRHSSSTSYRARTDWLQYCVNIVTRVTVDSQQKTNLVHNNFLDPKIITGFSASIRYTKRCLFCVVSYVCAGNMFDHGNPMEMNKYKISYINQIIMILFAIYSTCLSKFYTNIPND